jgi:hypothetical protein
VAEADRDLIERVHAAIGTGPAGWTDVSTIHRRVYGDRPPTTAQTTAVAAALATLGASGAITRAGDSYRQLEQLEPGGERV